jgi:hypothetical protein
MFTAAKDVETAAAVETTIESEESGETISLTKTGSATSKGTWEFTDAALLQEKRELIVDALNYREEVNLIKRSRALYWDAGHTIRVACTISKRYTKRSYPYWYAHHPAWEDFLAEGKKAFLVLGCMDLAVAFAVPWQILHPVLDGLTTTQKEDSVYWHINLTEPEPGELSILLPKRNTVLRLKEYTLPLKA